MLNDDSLARLRQLAADVHADPWAITLDTDSLAAAARVDVLALGVVQLLDDLADARRQRDALRTALAELLETTGAIIEDTRPSLYSNDRRRIEQARAAIACTEALRSDAAK
jgi:hypothetical protein